MVKERKKKTVVAQEFILEDENGRERAALRMDGARNAFLLFRDPGGDIRLHAGVLSDGTPRVNLHYSGGKGSILLEANDRSNTAALTITGPGGTVQAAIGVAPNGRPVIVLLDEEGNVVSSSETAQAGTDGNDWRKLLGQ